MARWLERAASVCRRFSDRRTTGFVAEELQADEIRSFAGGKTRPTWVFAAIEVWSRLWTSTVVGRRSYRNTLAGTVNLIEGVRFSPRSSWTSALRQQAHVTASLSTKARVRSGNPENTFTKDEILTLVSIYWHTGSIGTAVRIYYSAGMFRTPPAPRTVGLTLENARARRTGAAASAARGDRPAGARGVFRFLRHHVARTATAVAGRGGAGACRAVVAPRYGWALPRGRGTRAARRGPAGVFPTPACGLDC